MCPKQKSTRQLSDQFKKNKISVDLRGKDDFILPLNQQKHEHCQSHCNDVDVDGACACEEVFHIRALFCSFSLRAGVAEKQLQ